ncbi:hypothetical protein OAO87_03155 [bacterium]|nr:hypothetical protein [bacterium]
MASARWLDECCSDRRDSITNARRLRHYEGSTRTVETGVSPSQTLGGGGSTMAWRALLRQP